jgi:Flp pilus assembly pilin Flp
MYTLLIRLIRDDQGEYGLITALIAVAAVTVMGTRRHEPQEHLQYHRLAF